MSLSLYFQENRDQRQWETHTQNTHTYKMASDSLQIPSNFKTSLPPRKRARTQEEKEQRRIERILRNRKAAHHSREKKRAHLEELEHKCQVMERLLACIGDLEAVVGDAGRESLQEYWNLTGKGSQTGQSPTEAALTPVSLVQDEEDQDGSWDLLLSRSQDIEPFPVTTSPDLFAGSDNSSFEFDDWRNPAVITATKGIVLR